MSKPSDPVEDFKRAVTATVRAIACDKEMTVSFGADALSGGGQTRLPQPARDLNDHDVALVRGSGDAVALWQRFHNRRVHARLSPRGTLAKAVFEAAEQARVESIGANRMIGISKNLDVSLEERCKTRGYANINEPGETVLPEIIGLLMREQFTGKAPPKNAEAMVDHLREWVADNAGEDIHDLADCLSDQTGFARLCRKLIVDLKIGDEEAFDEDDMDDSADADADQNPDGMGDGEGESGEGEAEQGADPEAADGDSSAHGCSR